MDFDNTIETPQQQPVQVELPERKSVPLQIKSDAVPRNNPKLSTDQIVAIVLMSCLLVGIIVMTLALTGVFNRTPPSVTITPSVVVPTVLPSVVFVSS